MNGKYRNPQVRSMIEAAALMHGKQLTRKVRDIMKRAGVCETTARSWIRTLRAGRPLQMRYPRGPAHHERRKKMARLPAIVRGLMEGRRPAEVGRELHCSDDTVYRAIQALPRFEREAIRVVMVVDRKIRSLRGELRGLTLRRRKAAERLKSHVA